MTQPTVLVADIVTWLNAHAPSARLIADTRQLQPGDVFLAYPGDAADGRAYMDDALSKGAAAIVAEEDGFIPPTVLAVPLCTVSNMKQLVGAIANAYYGQPDAAMFSVAITGTNGKTSCSQWIARALSGLGTPTAVIGTLGVGLYRNANHAGLRSNGYTTPDAATLQCELKRLAGEGAQALAIEASSIGLHQGRLNGMHFDVAVLTNFTRDHLDYHGDMAAYEDAKRALFDWPQLKHAVINLDDPMGVRLVAHLRSAHPEVVITGYAIDAASVEDVAALCATDVRASHAGTSFRIESPFGNSVVKTQLVGKFNVSNVLAVIGVLLSKGVAFKQAVSAVEALKPVPGRMQQIGGQDAPLVVIDYAHTPDALQQTLHTLRDVANQRGGKLWCVFGCGGDRDPGKRAHMGTVAQAADQIVITNDNPRSEDPSHIVAQIRAGIDAARLADGSVLVNEDRAGAILWAVRHAAKQDVVLLAGKGHEATQEIKGKKLPFVDEEHAAIALAARVTMKGVQP